MRKVLFIGMPGSGKGTQAKLLGKYGLIHISTGELIRDAIKRKDPLLAKYKKQIESGGLIPDEVIVKLIEKNVKKIKGKGYILDGAVRTLKQGKVFLKKKLIEETIYFSLPKKTAVERILHRRKTSKEKRKDDNPQVIKKRFEEYCKKTAPVLKYLKEKSKKYYNIDASPSIKKIHKEVLRVLGIGKFY